MYDRKKLTIKGRFSDVCFRQKMLSGPKDRSFTPPENLPGEGLKHTFIREKWRFSAFGQNASWAQIYPQNEKTDAENFEIGRPFFYFPEKFSPPQTGEFFESQKEEHFHFSKNSPGETGTSFCLKKEFEHRENGRKEIRTSDLYSWPVIRKNQTGRLS